MAVRFRIWRDKRHLRLVLEDAEGQRWSGVLCYNEAERLRHKLGKVMDRVVEKERASGRLDSSRMRVRKP